MARQNQLEAFDLLREQVEVVAPVDVACDLLSEIGSITEGVVPVDNTGDAVRAPLRNGDDGRPFVIGNVAQSKWNAVPFKDMPHCDAKGRPRKLDQDEHGVYMTEARGKVKTGRDRWPGRPLARGTRALGRASFEARS